MSQLYFSQQTQPAGQLFNIVLSQWSWVKNFSSIPNKIISISTKNLLTSCFPKKEEEEFYTPFRKSKIYSHFKMPSPQICSVDLL